MWLKKSTLEFNYSSTLEGEGKIFDQGVLQRCSLARNLQYGFNGRWSFAQSVNDVKVREKI